MSRGFAEMKEEAMRAAFMYGAGDDLYLRSVNGPDAAWYRYTRTLRQGRIQARGVARDVTWIDVNATGEPDIDPAVDAEYARKYQGSAAAIAHITSPLARTTTMRAEPRRPSRSSRLVWVA
jgi:hypothetical protein